MLEDELRDLFAARVRTPPVAAEAAAAAIRVGRRKARRRQAAAGTAVAVFFLAALGGAAGGRPGAVPRQADDTITFGSLFGDADSAIKDQQSPRQASPVPLPVLAMPVDLRVGNELWTMDGRHLDLGGVGVVRRVVKVPAGWVYSGDQGVRKLTADGLMVSLASGSQRWALSTDGARLSIVDAQVLSVVRLDREGPSAVQAKTRVSADTDAAAFIGERVALINQKTGGYDHWGADGATSYTASWNNDVLAVFGNGSSRSAVGLARSAADQVCLVDLSTATPGLRVSATLGCDDLLTSAVDQGVSSPDGAWLAVPSRTGVHLVDVTGTRAAAATSNKPPTTLVVRTTCAAKAGSPAVWADKETVLTVSENSGVVACRTDGTQLVVPLPAGVTTGWELVPTIGAEGTK
jgi:hypothetical protein